MPNQLQRTKAHLAFMTGHDQLLALMLIGTSFIFLPFLFLIYPFLRFATDLVLSWRLTRTEKSTIRQHVHIPRGMILRRAKHRESHVYSIPFLSILYVNQELINNLDMPSNRGLLLHEIGHHGRNDATVILWIRQSLIIWIILSPFVPAYFIMLFLGVEEYAGTHLDLFQPNFILIMSLAAIIPIFILFTHNRFAHKRELLADAEGTETDRAAVSAFLKYGEVVERHRKKKFSLLPKWLLETHPSFNERLRVQDVGLEPTALSTFAFSFQWAAFMVCIFIFSQLGTAPFIIEEELLGLFWPLFPQIMGLFSIFCVGVFISRASRIVYQQHRFFLWNSLGYAVGFTVSFGGIGIINYLHYPVAGFSLTEALVHLTLSFPVWIGITVVCAIIGRHLGAPNLGIGFVSIAVFTAIFVAVGASTSPEASTQVTALNQSTTLFIWFLAAISALILGIFLTLVQAVGFWILIRVRRAIFV